MDIKEKIKTYYDKGIYNNAHIQKFVEKKIISYSDYQTITKEKFNKNIIH